STYFSSLFHPPPPPPRFPYTTLFRSESGPKQYPLYGSRRLCAGAAEHRWPTHLGGLGSRCGRAGSAPPVRALLPGRQKPAAGSRSEEHTSELQSRENLVCRLLLEKKK